MFTRKLRTAYALLLPFFLLATFSVASAATVTIINLDVAGTGLNDTTPATPVGGNAGTTKGDQALIVFEEAASIWGGILGSPVEIKVGSSFAALSCSATSGVLGSAGPQTAHRDFANAPLASTWYPQALANSLAGADLDAATNDIGMQFNGSMGTPGCLESLSWYMGLDAVEPANTISLLSVALHEIGHGLGFASFVTLSTGALFNALPDGYSSNLEDHSTGLLYPAMTNAQRVAASTNTGNLHWTGALVVAASGVLSSGAHASGHVEMYAPNPAQQGSSVSHFSTSLTPNELMEPSHTGPDLHPGLAVPLLQDMGWALATGCGDGVLDVGEDCDDGNTLGGDCCSSSCTFETAGSTCTDDGDACTTDTCNGTGTCDHPAAADGSACDDGIACTTGETCQAGTCLSSTPACDDNESCTVDTCEVSDCFSTGHGAGCNDPVCESTVCALDSYCCATDWDNLCVNGGGGSTGSVDLCAGRENFCGNAGSPDGTLCDDGDPATGGDVCTGGVCAGTGDLCAGVTCSASDQCHDVGTCDPGTGICSDPALANGTACDDSDACTQTDTCQAGVCTGTNSVVCNALDQCHVAGTCDPGTGSCNDPASSNGTACDDGDPATTTDVCTGGVCGGTDLCAGVTCSASDQCHDVGTCDPGTGLCSDPALANGTACDDGDLATTGDQCSAGVCSGTIPPPPAVVSISLPAGDPVPGQIITGELLIETSVPLGNYGIDINCDAALLTIVPPVSGGNTTEFTAAPVQNLGACSATLSGFQFSSLTSPTGVVSVAHVQFEVLAGAVAGSSSTVDLVPSLIGDADGNSLAFVALDNTITIASVCGNGLLEVGEQCDDSNTDAGDCCSATCTFEPGSCDDGAFCTTGETCTAGVCGGGGLTDCSGAGDQCHSGSCNESSNACEAVVANEGNACDDGAFCTTGETCTAGACGGGGGRDCSGAGDQCHSGSCNESSNACEAVVANEGNACDDGAFCTTGETCTAGACGGGGGRDCSGAGTQCNTGSCNENSNACEAVAANEGASCDDGNVATTSDVCTGGVCSGVDLCAAVTCTASDQCHDSGVCNQATGICSDPAADNGTVCDDGDPATTSDVCTGGVCSGVDLCAAVTCTASDQCHDVGSCDQGTGVCSNPAASNGSGCDDGDPATTSDVCTGGVCSGLDLCAAVSCTASDQCHTVGTCDPNTGLCGDPIAGNGTLCNDSDPATTSDVCTGGVCSGVDLCAAVTCTASDQCHDAGTCDATTGACNDPASSNGTACDDGDPVTTGDECVGGVCGGTDLCAAVTCTASDQCHVAGTCDPGTGACSDPIAGNGTLCDDGDLATTSDVCTGGVCSGVDLCAAVTCTASDQCHDVGICASSTGVCNDPASANATVCDDGDPATTSDVCTGGVCSGLDLCAAVTCTASDQCHDAGTCAPLTGACSDPASANGTACDDGDLCSDPDFCSSGVCEGLVTDCSGLDGNCVLGSCDVANGNCAAEALADGGGCDDGDLCTESDQCSSGACVGAAGALFESTSMKLGLRGAGEDKLSLKSQAALADMLGLPTSGGVELVLSDSLGNPVYFASIAAGDWEDVRDQGSKFKFKDRTGTLADGILKALLKVNTRRGIVLLKAKGKNLDLQAATGEASLWLSVVVGGSLSGSCTSAPAMVCTTRGRNLKCEL